MSKLVIDNGVVIDDAEAVLEGISKLSGMSISSAETFKSLLIMKRQ